MLCLQVKLRLFATQLVLMLVGGLSAASIHASELPSPLRSAPSIQLELLGDTTVRWLGFTLYDAALWSENALFDGTDYSDPVALSITYRKRISSEQLIKVTDKQMRKLNVANQAKRTVWIQQLKSIWPDVGPGDVIASVVMPDGETSFYSDSKLLGAIDDPEFGPGFLAIWLSPESLLPNARRQLLGVRTI